MSKDDDFTDLMARAKSGDPVAIRVFLSRFEWEVQMMVRARLPRKLRIRFDSTDFAQSVWQSFFSDLRDKSPDFENVQHLRAFLKRMVWNKVQEQHRRLTRTEKCNLEREERLYIRRGDRDVPREVVSPEPSPSQTVQADDRLVQLTAGRAPAEAAVIRLRRQGLTFDEIAARTGFNERTVRRFIEAARIRMEAQK
jgi:DNA-directed RNA polymerase specialized sigma24 family protein